MTASDTQGGLKDQLKTKAAWICGFVVLIWGIEVVDSLLGKPLAAWGILPRTAHGLWGILTAPFLHHGFTHVAMNTVPFVVLGGFVILRGVGTFVEVSVIITLVGGAGTWLFGRSALHAGASGLIFGYLGYLVARGWFERSLVSILVAVITVLLYGSIIWGVLPSHPYISWEGHLFGLLAGILAAKLGSDGRADGEA